MASSSQTVSASLPLSAESSSDCRWKYDVFLSFRGPDTRRGITSELHDRLQNRRGIKTFMDDPDLQVGDVISPTLVRAIEESRFAIVVLSEQYAHSTWCLEELTKICECMEDNNRILPLFYNVEPTNIRYEKMSFGEAFTNHENSGRHRSEKLQQWRDALNKVAHFSGWDSKKYKTDRELVDAIVDFVCKKVQPEVEFILSTGDFEAFEATRKAMDEVMMALKDDEVTAVGVYGMGGVGKTTMVKHVGAQACRNEVFHHVIIAVVSQSPDFKTIQHTLAELLGFKLVENSESGRASRLYKEIMRKANTLIILYDIWEILDLSRIGIPSYEELKKCNSKVLLTTRIWNVCFTMKCQENITLSILSQDDSWTLFVRNARRSFESTKFEDVARKVARECCGLPIALIAVARAVGDKDLVEWEKAAGRLEKSQTANPHDKGDVSKCIKLSYDYLENEVYKSCFLLCCLFPEDYNILIEDLTSFAIGKGLFRADTIQEAKGQADSVVKYLKDSSLLLDGKNNNFVKMHDVVRDTAMKIAQADGDGFLVKPHCGLRDWPCQSDEGYSAVSLFHNKICKLPEELVCPKCQILLLQENADLYEIPQTFFQSMNELKVLDLSHTSVSLLPQSFSFLTNLHVLYLDFCFKIIDISILGKLKKLEILSMREYPLKELPREIALLTNLRVLDVRIHSYRNSPIYSIPSKVISKLHRLEELNMYCGFWDWGRNGEHNRGRNPGRNPAPGRNRGRGLDWGRGLRKFLRCGVLGLSTVFGLSPFLLCGVLGLSTVFGLSLVVGLLTVLAETLNEEATQKLQEEAVQKFKEELAQMRNEEEGLDRRSVLTTTGFDEVTSLSKLNNLKVSISNAVCIPRNVKFYPNWVYFDIRISSDRTWRYNQFAYKTRTLSLDTTMTTLPDWFVKVVTEKTEKLEYERCSGLSNILLEYNSGRLHGLKHLSVIGPSTHLKVLINAVPYVPDKPVFENLEELFLERLDALKVLCIGELPPGSLCNLKGLRVLKCHKLENILLPSTLLQRLPNLEKLICKDMDNIEYILGYEGFESKESKLRQMKFMYLNAVRRICKGPAPRAMFQALESLYIVKCNFVGGLFWVDAAQCLFQLEDLWIQNCPLLERLIEVSKETVNNNKKIVLPKLKSLVLEGLPMLCGGSDTVDFECPSLEHLYVKECLHFSVPTSASDYFHSRNHVQFNNKQHYKFLHERLEANMWVPEEYVSRSTGADY